MSLPDQLALDRFPEKALCAELVRSWQWERGLVNRIEHARKVDQCPILVRPRDRTDAERLRRASAEDDPFPIVGADEARERVDEVAHDASPRADASRAKGALQSSGSSN